MDQRISILNTLNEHQLQAATTIEGAVLVLAGAGSGKTKTLTCRIAYMVHQGISPHNILAVTFTNKAAREMKKRVIDLIGIKGEEVTISTFHSFGVRYLRIYAPYFGYESNFNIYDIDDQKKLVTQIVKEAQISTYGLTSSKLVSRISKLKEEGILPDEYEKVALSPFERSFLEIYRTYQRKLKEHNSLDFADILIYTFKMLQNEEALKELQRRYTHFMIDEYQDTNSIQYNIIKKLCSKTNNIFVVGDEDQSIYGFRGADISKILNFEKDFPLTKVYKLERNYRSTINILNVANAVIKNNISSKGKVLWTDLKGEHPRFYSALDSLEEARYVSSIINSLLSKDYKYKNIAILYRNNSQSREFEEEFIRRGIPYKIYGGMQFYQRKEIKDIIAYLSLIKNFKDNLSFLRIINTPSRGIGSVSLLKLEEFARQNSLSLYESLHIIDQLKLTAASSNSLVKFRDTINRAKEISKEGSVIKVIEFLLDATGYIKELEEAHEQDRIENITELINSIKVSESKYVTTLSLEEYLEQISLAADVEEEFSDNHVKLMTIHNSKGLEFEVIFIVGLEEEILPSARAIFSDDEIEEERRLFYVALTRAKRLVYITNAQNRAVYNSSTYLRESSRFLREIPKEHIILENSSLEEKRIKKDEIKVYSFTEETEEKINKLFGFAKGDKVSHPNFGKGKIVEVDLDKITIYFDNYGEKKFVTTTISKFLVKS